MRVSTTVAMSMAATVAAMIAIFGETDPVTVTSIVFALVGLVPWVLEVSGIRLQPIVFLLLTMFPASVIVLLDENPGGLFPVLIAVVWLLQRTTSRAIIAVALFSALAMTVGHGIAEPSEFQGTVYFLGGIGIAWLSGLLLRRQERLLVELREATERERAHAAVEERTRIAREVHDVIAHSLTVTILHVTGARRALTNDPQRAADALERAEIIGRESLDSIRQVVGILRRVEGSQSSADNSNDTPLPLLSNIPALIDQYRAAGLDIDGQVWLDGVSAGAMTSLTVFRLVQEAMTNALRHAPGAPVSLSICPDQGRSSIRIRVENPLSDDAARRGQGCQQGLGMTGMAERVRACGGSMDIGPTESATWLVDVELPMDLVLESR